MDAPPAAYTHATRWKSINVGLADDAGRKNVCKLSREVYLNAKLSGEFAIVTPFVEMKTSPVYADARPSPLEMRC